MKKTVLVVDDSPTIRAQVSALIGGSYEVVTAPDGVDGLQLALAHPPAAAIVDLEMPRLDGVGLLEKLRQDVRTRNVPVVVMTTVMAVERVNACRALGCAGFVLKPVDGEYLLAKLRHLVGTKP